MRACGSKMLVGKGIVGDWSLGDDEFMDSFRLPHAAERLDTLKHGVKAHRLWQAWGRARNIVAG